MRLTSLFVGAAVSMSLACSTAYAQVPSADEVAKLGITGTELTPSGAIRAGNEAGTIPAWTGGITEPPAGFEWPNYIDPYAGDEILFTITSANYQEYADQLTEGQKEMFRIYPETFKMNIYPTRRSWSAPEWVYEKTIDWADKTTLDETGNNPVNHPGGSICYPLAQNANQARLNIDPRRCNYYGWREDLWYNHTLVDPSGSRQTVHIHEWHYKPMDEENAPLPDSPDFDPHWYVMQLMAAPARQRGQAILYIAHLSYSAPGGGERIWSYNPGQRRVLRAPQLKYDYPYPGSNGMVTNDQAYTGTQGDIDRYDYELLPTQEMFIPYNSYRLADRSLNESDIIGQNHINPDLLRYELHRVRPVVATLKSEYSMIYSKRVFYADEDSWWNMATDLYDQDGNLWRYEENYTMNFYDHPLFHRLMEGKYDLRGGYVAELVDLEVPSGPRKFNDAAGDFDASFYTIGNLKSLGH